jgi:dTDP-4-amino-4,6-dideoxygalactose transaminase
MTSLKQLALTTGRAVIRFVPKSAARLQGPLAIDGGTPVRDIRWRPWAPDDTGRRRQWREAVGPAFRDVFLSGIEGLPQTRQSQFAERWAAYCGCKHGLLLPHGTDALRFALAAACDHDGLDYGGEVIVPNLSFIASATAAWDRRFGVALVDVDAATLNLDPRRVEEAIVPGTTRAIVPVHQFGQPADMTALGDIARRHQLVLIEDAAQAHGAVWENGPVGSLGDAAAFSFQSAKNLTAGEGGMLTTNNTALFERAHALHNAGRAYGVGSRWEHETLGWNCRGTEYQAALLSHRFGRFPEQQAIRKGNFSKLRELLSGVQSVEPIAVDSRVREHGMYMFVVRYRPERCGGAPVTTFLDAIRAEGAPLHRCYVSTIAGQPAVRALRERRPQYVRVMPTPVADQAVTNILYIAASVFLGPAGDMDDIAAAIAKVERAFAQRRFESAS